jgi:hypothetical protein
LRSKGGLPSIVASTVGRLAFSASFCRAALVCPCNRAGIVSRKIVFNIDLIDGVVFEGL